MALLALVLSAVATVLAGVACWHVRQQAFEARYTARAARAAVELQHDLIDRMARAAEAKHVIWDLEPLGEATYLLRNEGTDTAYDVRVDVGDIACRGPVHVGEFPPGHVERYQLFRPLGTVSDAVTVTWNQSSSLTDEPRTHQLPVLHRPGEAIPEPRATGERGTEPNDTTSRRSKTSESSPGHRTVAEFS
ncbi:hypothetical protein [Haloechinothrix sp. LS1_15]|uniref:hypothetical protein n=1 Tax=Haloechinothrix sp. LS1_15 TaxID=2652248 RepID=UPI002945177F|nr:hypothetical protein [Haloechinothrix sp. LS1_15]MDV6014274.1 hypothetical protein [Haloechinothrix sp. LS1_15]